MKKSYFTINTKLLIAWIALSVIYFGGLKIFEIYFDYHSESPEFAITLLFLWSAPIFMLASGILAYKATSRVIIPNVVTTAIMGLANVYDCFADAKEAYREHITVGINNGFGAELLETLSSLLFIALLLLLILIFFSAETKSFDNRSKKSNDACTTPNCPSEAEVKKTKIASVSKHSNDYIVWIAVSVIYWGGLKIFEVFFDLSDFAGLATVILFLWSAPFFSVISGILSYKATSKVILPNLLNVAVMILVNAKTCFEEAEINYRQSISIGHSCTFGEKVLELFAVVLLIALPIYIISVIASAIMKWLYNRREQKSEQASPDISNSLD